MTRRRWVQARAIGIEDANQMRVEVARAMIRHHQRLAEALGLVVDRARAYRFTLPQ